MQVKSHSVENPGVKREKENWLLGFIEKWMSRQHLADPLHALSMCRDVREDHEDPHATALHQVMPSCVEKIV